MSKLISFLVIVPFMALLIYKSILFYEFETKQRYIKDLTDSLTYKVKITGVLTQDDYDTYKANLDKIAKFNSASVIINQGRYVDGSVKDWSTYTIGTVLNRGQAFMIYVKSTDVSLFSRLQNGGVMAADEKNLHYVTKAQCRIEKDN